MPITINYTHVYPYSKTGELSSGPVIPLDLFSGQYASRTNALIDSGASYPLFDMEVAEALHLRFSPTDRLLMVGVGRNVYAYGSFAHLRFGPLLKAVRCKLYFAENLNTPNLLGRIGVFEHVQIGLDEAKKQFYMRVNE